MDQLPLTAVILTKNEQTMIVQCLETLKWCKEVIVIDNQSSDATAQLAKRAGAMVYTSEKKSFSELRNYALTKVRTEWVFYIDADERVTPQLYKELSNLLLHSSPSAVRFRRGNIHYGKLLQNGGWEKDLVTRLFKVKDFTGWTGKVHESAEFNGSVVEAHNPLLHLTHRNMVDGLHKTIEWTGHEAELLFEAHHPKVTPRMLIRKTLMEFIRRAFLWKGRKDGIEGWIEAMTQAMNRFIVYERLWEMQRKPSLPETYQQLDEQIITEWKNL